MKSAYLNGELCALNADGVPVFSRLQAATDEGCTNELVFLPSIFVPERRERGSTTTVQEVLGEADALIRCLLEERAVEVPHAARGGRVITLTRLQLVTGLGTRTSSQR